MTVILKADHQKANILIVETSNGLQMVSETMMFLCAVLFLQNQRQHDHFSAKVCVGHVVHAESCPMTPHMSKLDKKWTRYDFSMMDKHFSTFAYPKRQADMHPMAFW